MLIDDLAQAPWLPAQVRALFAGATVFEINDIAAYARDRWLSATDAIEFPPNCAPLAPTMFLEWNPHGWGYTWDGASALGLLLAVVADAAEGTWWPDWGFESASVPEGTRWIYEGTVAYQSADRTAFLADLLEVFIDARGAVLKCQLRGQRDDLEPPDERAIEQYKINLLVALTAVCFAHCKGVTITDHQQPRQRRRAAERAGQPALVTYKTIDIAPVTRILHDEGHVERTGLHRAMHVCRGHFAHYTDERPLFGKYTGTFYVPMHVRGRRDRGTVIKDYRVKRPQDDRR